MKSAVKRVNSSAAKRRKARAANETIMAENILATGPVYTAMMFESMRVFEVVTRLVQLVQEGALAIGQGTVDRKVLKHGKEALALVPKPERLKLYKQFFGTQDDQSEPSTNREFGDLWLRFVSAVSSLTRQHNVDSLSVNKAARELAANLSRRGKDRKAAVQLTKQVGEVTRFLSAPAIKQAFDGRDMWQVIEEVSNAQLGGAKNVDRYRGMMAAALTVIAWLAKNSQKLNSTNDHPIIKPSDLNKPSPPFSYKANSSPSNGYLITACEEWLAAATMLKRNPKS